MSTDFSAHVMAFNHNSSDLTHWWFDKLDDFLQFVRGLFLKNGDEILIAVDNDIAHFLLSNYSDEDFTDYVIGV